MRHAKLSLILAAFLMFAAYLTYRHTRLIGAQAGQATAASHPAPVADVPISSLDLIDGAKHPELIPDSIAYRLFFLTLAEPADATPEAWARQRAYLRTAGLGEEDVQAAADVLADFKVQHDEIVDQYNESVEIANQTGGRPDLAGFLAQQDKLVESTREALRAALGPEIMQRLDAHIQREKRNMKMAKEAR